MGAPPWWISFEHSSGGSRMSFFGLIGAQRASWEARKANGRCTVLMLHWLMIFELLFWIGTPGLTLRRQVEPGKMQQPCVTCTSLVSANSRVNVVRTWQLLLQLHRGIL